MTEPVFYADPMRLLIASAAGILLLLFLIIKLKLHPVISMMISAVLIGIGAGMPLHMIDSCFKKYGCAEHKMCIRDRTCTDQYR